jgi:hypothetical protein
MTLPASGTLSLNDINTEFNLGRNLAAYRGQRWFRDDNTRGYFDDSTTGNFPPIDVSEFYSKRSPSSVSFPVGQVNTYTSVGTYSFPINFFYNTLLIEVRGGNGADGQDGTSQYECNGFDYKGNPICGFVWRNGANGAPGTASSFGSFVSGAGGAGGNGATGSGGFGKTSGLPGTYNSIIINAETNSSAPLKGSSVSYTVGSGTGSYVRITVQS